MYRPTAYARALIILFVLTLPLCNPWVRGDGVGYYAYVRSLLIEKHFNFEKDWLHGNESFVMSRLGDDGRILASQYTVTGHIANLWSVGPSILWSPFLVATHLGVLLCDHLGAHIPPDGFSTPYLIAMALATSLYGFLGLWISFHLARKYFPERWAFLATLGIWWGSCLPVYMYFNPSWSHAHSAFVVALFLWYWQRTRIARTVPQWILLGLISGLMVDVYYPNGLLLLIPLLEAIVYYWRIFTSPAQAKPSLSGLFFSHVLYFGAFLFAMLPTLITRSIIFGNPFSTGYPAATTWAWKSPALWNVLFSSDHGMLSWTPILILALIGIVLFRRVDRLFATSLLVSFFAFYLVISFYPDWDGLSSFGNRFFVSFTPLFILGLAALFDWLTRAWHERRTVVVASAATAVFIVWNLGLVFQWGTHLIPARGPISWRAAAYNQVAVVPVKAAHSVKNYFSHRISMMNRIEEEDVRQLKSQPPEGKR